MKKLQKENIISEKGEKRKNEKEIIKYTSVYSCDYLYDADYSTG